MTKLRLLVVDDSAMYRLILKSIVETIPGIECIGEAADGKEAIEKIIKEMPDIVTLDMEMPVMSGMDVLKKVVQKKLRTKLIVVSACSRLGAQIAMNALKLGAYDFITKPNGLGGRASMKDIRQQLVGKLKELNSCSNERMNEPLKQGYKDNKPSSDIKKAPVVARKMVASTFEMSLSLVNTSSVPRAIAIGCSTGGPKALLQLFSGSGLQLDVPIFIVQHMPPIFTRALAKSINDISSVSVKEAENGDKPLPNHAYVAPGGRQMKLVNGNNGIEIKITDDEPDNFFNPSVDYFFKSVAEIYKSRTLGIILTGMGSDGICGLKEMKRHGAIVLSQDEASCVVYGMPRAAKEAGLIDREIGLDGMPSAIRDVLILTMKKVKHVRLHESIEK